MRLRFVRNLLLAYMVITRGLSAAALSDSLQTGKAYYFAGEFKKAISQFESSIKRDPSNPEPYLWLGRSYELLADTKPPFASARAHRKARLYLAEAAVRAPDCTECRSELFQSLVISDSSSSALREAKALLEGMSPSDPNYESMQSLLHEAQEQRSSPEEWTTATLGSPAKNLPTLTAHTDHPIYE